jgi:2-oxo-4-hydroxy-4-carboxy-5-ureidoimidazoline decarboxylase
MTLHEINGLSQTDFVRVLAGIVEHSPWVAAAAWSRRPFADVDSLHRALVDELLAASLETQLAVIRAHPELAGRAAARGHLTPESTEEQGSAGLTRCSEAELDRLRDLNHAYNAKFGFPFILAVRGFERTAIIEQFSARLANDRTTELAQAVEQIGRIVRLRLEALLGV